MMIHFLQVLLHSDKLLVGSGLKYADDNKFFFLEYMVIWGLFMICVFFNFDWD